ncbi:hypothetical protein FRACYDRAFT_239689 [Fragilariopsis cylindrus CCMP1102]|uniref:F-box domain-containing protein n=1 Tax=Fragilariopsis cylindrus CCMP1102 TaxID=635003 RepID=A0A1E7FA44_9STRA|nr:hypothetical protein FRACYDRAFT_239689 [Fragilariopsis cylindrus CCMP1102]|eukprot:OEU15009.1 hypothetical protein FRACYDRAFT_239689 [Fragilariopsis cylindrus CCMP1102]
MSPTSSEQKKMEGSDKNDNGKRPYPRPSPSLDDDDGLPLLNLLDLHVDLRISIFNYLGQTQEDLFNLTLVSKKVNTDCKSSSIKWKIIPTIEISPTKRGAPNKLLRQLKQLCHHELDNDTKKKIRRYTHMKVNNLHEFNICPSDDQIPDIAKEFGMDWILSLDLSLLTPTYIRNPVADVLCTFSTFLPKLCEINLSNISQDDIDNNYFMDRSLRFQNLEKLIWNNNYGFRLSGFSMKALKNLKEIIMDDSKFYFFNDEMSNLDNHRDKFIFHYCSKNLERVSIRNAKGFGYNYSLKFMYVFPQNALIKFVRNSPPSLRWFRSDLTQDNMTMLRLERPEIELLN